MHRNTYLLVSALAVIAALVVGVNIGRRFEKPQRAQTNGSPTPVMSPSLSVATTSAMKSYRNAFCKVSFDYPDDLTVFENASGSAAFTGAAADEGILLTCQKEIPRPAIAPENTEDVRIGSLSARLYHTQEVSDGGAALDTLIFRHPGTRLDVFLAGTGEAFRKLISTVRLLP